MANKARQDASAVADKTTLNGDLGDHLDQALADASGGSDTDISRPGSVDPTKQEAGHVRTNSTVKKPSAFKSVSVTKNFLAKSAVATPAARTGDKAAPAAPSAAALALTAKPRLVAKLGTGNVPRTLGKVNGASAGPDASKVWNKNQPVPPAPPKQFTDEELKQQYGIHLATRLQADEAGKEAKWADIDDDEDDWAPETVQWMDGTKSSGAAAENEPPPPPPPAPVEEPKTILKAPEKPAETAKPTPPAATSTPKSSVTGGTKTILKPGGHAQTSTGKTSLVLKGQPEKPTLVTKASTTEKKSPWASLPPVEKVSPLHVNPPPQQAPTQRYQQRDSYGYDPMPPLPAKEIAPDDFNRAWRDERGSRPELYNSHSGRFDPVHEMRDSRRGSTRDTGYQRQPSVLQRPSQDGGSGEPAGPSAAFQTSRSSGDLPTWGRRRNSSNVSGGNGRRMSIDRRGTDMPTGPVPTERRQSQSVNGVDPSDTGASRQPSIAQATSPSGAQTLPASPHQPVTTPDAQNMPTPAVAPPVLDHATLQQRTMAEKLEQARLNKQKEAEEAKKEEAEKKERLAKRLAAMGPVEPKSKAKAAPSSGAPGRSPKKVNVVPAAAQPSAKSSAPTTEGKAAQQAVAKTYQSQSTKQPAPEESAPVSKPVTSAEPAPAQKAQPEPQKSSPPPEQRSAQPSDTPTRENGKGRQPMEQAKGATTQSVGAVPTGPKPQGAWPPKPRSGGWTSQVWGPPPTKERALGNGTFVPNYDRTHPRSGPGQQLPVQSHPTAPGSTMSQTGKAASTSQPLNSQAGPPATHRNTPVRPGPIAPPDGKWSNFAAHIKQDDQNVVAKARQEMERMGGDSFRPEIRETYKDQRGQAQTTQHDPVAGKAMPHDDVKNDDSVKAVHKEPSPQQTLSQGPPLQQTTGPRASRFFPRSSEAPTQPELSTQTATPASGKRDSPPPPPETETHPVFSGNVHEPRVQLPKPPPVVRLPPSVLEDAAPAEAPVSMPSRSASGLGARPLTKDPEWQARFNKLFEKTGPASQTGSGRPAAAVPILAPTKPGSLPIAPSSKATLEVRGTAGPATVSLPGAPSSKRFFANDLGRDVVTRKGTEVLFEDREFGSLPTVKLSKVPHLAAKKPAVSPPTHDARLIYFKKLENPFTTRRLEAFDFEKGALKVDVVIRLEGMQQNITKSMHRGRRGPKPYSQTNKPKQTPAPKGSTPNGARIVLAKCRNRVREIVRPALLTLLRRTLGAAIVRPQHPRHTLLTRASPGPKSRLPLCTER